MGGVVYYVLCTISPPPFVAEAKSLPFESMGKNEVLSGVSGVLESKIEDIESKGNEGVDIVPARSQ